MPGAHIDMVLDTLQVRWLIQCALAQQDSHNHTFEPSCFKLVCNWTKPCTRMPPRAFIISTSCQPTPRPQAAEFCILSLNPISLSHPKPQPQQGFSARITANLDGMAPWRLDAMAGFQQRHVHFQSQSARRCVGTSSQQFVGELDPFEKQAPAVSWARRPARGVAASPADKSDEARR